MYHISINANPPLETSISLNGELFEGLVGNSKVEGSIIKINDYQFHILCKGNSYNVDLLKINREEKTLVIKINGSRFNLSIADKYDALLKSLGMDNLSSKKINDVKAPMPGMVLNVLVQEGAEVKKGDALIVLEAMKMENILKSPSDGIIKKIIANKGKAVEKNEVLIQF